MPEIEKNAKELKDSKPKSYIEVFNENYYGLSDQAKELEKQLKKRVTGSSKVSYIPWATMVRMATQQDPDFVLIKQENASGSFIHYHGRLDANGVTLDDPVNFVKVTATFMGKTMSEEYPIQDFDFEPVTFAGRKRILSSGKTTEIKLDSNIVNKALQRATAKVLSELTGLGLSLYESGDLQFEEDSAPSHGEDKSTVKVTKPVTTKEKTTTTSKETKPNTVVTTNVDNKTEEVIPQEGIPLITEEQIVKLKEFQKDEKKALRLEKALASYKVADIEHFTEAQAKIIINALSK